MSREIKSKWNDERLVLTQRISTTLNKNTRQMILFLDKATQVIRMEDYKTGKTDQCWNSATMQRSLQNQLFITDNGCVNKLWIHLCVCVYFSTSALNSISACFLSIAFKRSNWFLFTPCLGKCNLFSCGILENSSFKCALQFDSYSFSFSWCAYVIHRQ